MSAYGPPDEEAVELSVEEETGSAVEEAPPVGVVSEDPADVDGEEESLAGAFVDPGDGGDAVLPGTSVDPVNGTVLTGTLVLPPVTSPVDGFPVVTAA